MNNNIMNFYSPRFVGGGSSGGSASSNGNNGTNGTNSTNSANNTAYAASDINLPAVSVEEEEEDSNTDDTNTEESRTICSSIVETTISVAIKEAELGKLTTVSNRDKPDFLITLNREGSLYELVESIEEIDFSKIPKLGGASSDVTPIYLKSIDHILNYYYQLTMVETKKNGKISRYIGSFIDGLSKLFAENETIHSSKKVQDFLRKFRKIE